MGRGVGRRRVRALPALLAACALGCAAPAGLDRGFDRGEVGLRGARFDGWLALRSPHLVLIGDASRAELARLAEDLAIFAAVVQRITSIPLDPARVPARIYLVRGPVADALVPQPDVQGYMAPRLDGYYGVVERSDLAPATRATLFHEYAHFLLRNGAALSYPMWYDEGFAEILATIRHRQGLVTVGTPPRYRLRALAGADRIDLEAVLAPRQLSEVRDADLFYATSWALTHYLLTHGETFARMERLLELQSQGVPWREAYTRAFPEPLETLAAAVARHVHELSRGFPATLALFDAEELPVERDFEIRELAPREVARELGEAALAVFDERGRGAVAAAFFERALEIDPRDARSRAGLAVARALQGRPEAARAELARASPERTDDVRILLAAGRVHATLAARSAGDAHAAAGERRAARAAYRRATRLDPRSPSGWAGLGRTYVGAEDPAAGIESLARARDLGAWDADVTLDLGRLHLGAGDAPRARELWMEVARLGDEERAEEARRLLEDLDAAASATR